MLFKNYFEISDTTKNKKPGLANPGFFMLI